MHWYFSAVDGLIISMTTSQTSASWVNGVLRSMSRTELALFERHAALYFPLGLSSPSQFSFV